MTAKAMHCFSGLRHRESRRFSLPPAGGGFTLFELIIVIILVALFAGVLLGRFRFYQEAAEKAAMEQTAGAIRGAINIRLAALIARGKTQDIARLAGINPVNLLSEKPPNYAGEYYGIAAGDIAPGSWYYDLRDRQLVYLVRGAHFIPDKNGNKRVSYRMTLVYDDGFSGTHDAARREVAGVILKEVTPYVWKPG